MMLPKKKKREKKNKRRCGKPRCAKKLNLAFRPRRAVEGGDSFIRLVCFFMRRCCGMEGREADSQW